MNLFTADIGSGKIHYYDSDRDIFYGKQDISTLITGDIPGIKRGDVLVIEDAHLRELVEGGKSLAHTYTFTQLEEIHSTAQRVGFTIQLFPHKKTPVVRKLAGYDSKDKTNRQFLLEYNMSTDEADVRSLAQFLKRDAEAFRCLKIFNPIREKTYHEKKEHIFDYRAESNLDLNLARTRGYGFDDDDDYDDAIHQFIENQKYEICNRLTGEGIFDLDGDDKFSGPELIKSIGLTYSAKGGGLNKISSESRLYTLVASLLRPDGKIRQRGFPPDHKFYGKMLPATEWKWVKEHYFGFTPYHMKSGVAASNIKYHMRPAISSFEGKSLPAGATPEVYNDFKIGRRRADAVIKTVWHTLRNMIVKDGLR